MAPPPPSPSPVQQVLDRLERPYDPVGVTRALLGVSHRLAERLISLDLATSPEAEALLAAMPRIVRSMSAATAMRPERCHGEVRGPVMWSETVSARSATAGDPALYVCATATKAYDTYDNRVLKAALDALWRAGSAADRRATRQPDPLTRRARHNGHRAGHVLEHRTLSGVPTAKVSALALRRARTGSRRSTYAPAIRFLTRAREPLAAGRVAAWADEATLARLEVLARVLAEVEERTGAPARLRRTGGTLVSGPVAYDPSTGVSVGGTPVEGAGDVARVVGSAPLAR